MLRKGKNYMSKLIKSLPILIILLFVFAGKSLANGLLNVYSMDMPGYINYDPFKISYTALQAEGKSLHTSGYLAKEGASWIKVGESDKLSDTFTIDGGILSGDGVYKIYFASSDGVNNAQSSEETFTIDRQAPGPVSDYKKDRKDSFLYRICWKNPDEEDFDRVIVYRSDKKEFQADSSTQIAEVGGTKNEDKCYDNGISENKDYYYVTRVVDHAGNISGVVGDSEVTTTSTTTSNVLGAEATPSVTGALSLPVVDNQTVQEETKKEGEIGGAGATQVEEEKITNKNFLQNISQEVKRLGWIRTAGIIIIFLGIVFLIIALLRKNRQ